MKQHLNSIIVAIAVIATAVILSNAFVNRNKHTRTISVTGLGKKDFTSDLVVWNGSFSKKSTELKQAYSDLDKDRETIRQYLIRKGIKADEIIFSAININKEFDQQADNTGFRKSIFTGYSLTQNVQVESKEVNKIEDISRQVSELINFGVELYSQSPEYYYTKLADLKVEMIAEATKDARRRAEKIAETAGGDLNGVKSANMGVFQITAQNSSEDFSWGGSFNTSAKKKTVTITMRLEYEVE